MFNVHDVRVIDFVMYFGKLCVEQNFFSNPKHSEELTSLLQGNKCHLYQLNSFLSKKFLCY